MITTFKTKNRIAANLLNKIISNSGNALNALEEISSISTKTRINYLADIYMLDNGDESSDFDLYAIVKFGSSRGDIEEIEYNNFANIFKAIEYVCQGYDSSSMGISDKELILSYCTHYSMENIASCLGWLLDAEIEDDDNYFFVKEHPCTKEWVRCEENDADYKILAQ